MEIYQQLYSPTLKNTLKALFPIQNSMYYVGRLITATASRIKVLKLNVLKLTDNGNI
jgi:hypothetical protein